MASEGVSGVVVEAPGSNRGSEDDGEGVEDEVASVSRPARVAATSLLSSWLPLSSSRRYRHCGSRCCHYCVVVVPASLVV